MKLAQIRNHHGQLTAAIFESGGYRPIDNYTVAALIARAEQQGRPLAETAEALAAKELLAGVQPDIPVCPPEVWACGCTYAPSAEFRDAELGTREGMYSYVYRAARPEIFFKGAARVCVGPGAPIGIRCDSKFTAPEPELAVVLNGRGKSRAIPWQTTYRLGISSGKTRSICRNPRSTPAAARSARCW